MHTATAFEFKIDPDISMLTFRVVVASDGACIEVREGRDAMAVERWTIFNTSMLPSQVSILAVAHAAALAVFNKLNAPDAPTDPA